MSVSLSRRAAGMPASPIRRLAHHAVEARRRGKTVFALNIGQPDIPTPAPILDRLRRFSEANIAYGPSQGLPAFVDALRQYYERAGISLSVDQLFVTNGGSEAILFVMAAVADPGDEVLVFEPFYTNYSGFGTLVGVQPVAVTTRAENGYHLPPRRDIEARIGPRTRAILFCSPNNPTGTVYDEDELDMLASICRDRNLYLVSDEVYREFCYDGRRHRSALDLPGLEDRVIVVDSLSKRLSMCGARIGNVACRNPEVMAAILKFGQARLCPPTVGQFAATAWGEVGHDYMDGVVAEYQRRRDLVYAALAGTRGVTVRKPEGAFYLCPRIPVDDAEDFAVWLLRDFDVGGETVMVAPADGFYATPGLGKDEIRIAYVLEERKLARAMDILTAAFAAYPGRKVEVGRA